MFTPDDRERIRASLIEAGRADPRITGGAITGSASTGNEDRWSDIDLAFGVRDASRIPDVLDDWTARMYRDLAGLPVRFVIPHVPTAIGWIVLLVLTLLAAIPGILSITRKRPSTLLAAGRNG